MVRNFLPQILFLTETKVTDIIIRKLAVYLGFPNVATVNSINNASGLTLFWSNDVILEISSSSMMSDIYITLNPLFIPIFNLYFVFYPLLFVCFA